MEEKFRQCIENVFSSIKFKIPCLTDTLKKKQKKNLVNNFIKNA